MYSNNFAAAILSNGRVLREFGDTVYLPFGSEYKIRLKNLGSTRAKISIEIDGRCVTDSGLVLRAGETADLERFIADGNLASGNKFKFIERTSKIEEYRGIQVDDGVISISYQFEIPAPVVSPSVYRSPLRPQTEGWYSSDLPVLPEGVILTNSAVAKQSVIAATNQVGITAEGSISNQSFGSTHWRGSTGPTHKLNIRLLGETEDNGHIKEAITTKTKLQCKYCGTESPATSRFCSECGAALSFG